MLKKSSSSNVVGIIYAGGSGKRLWPISTEKNPKQLSSAFTGTILLEEAYRRARRIFDKKDIYVVVTKQIYEKIFKLLDLPADHYFVQPRNDDTAVAMGIAALCLNAERPGVTAVTFYSDQTVSHFAEYERAIKNGVTAALKYDSLVTIGTFPTQPNTQFGYIKLGKKYANKLFHAENFVEKPDIKIAKKMVSSKKYVWNTGTYIWQAPTLLRLFKHLDSSLYRELIRLEPGSCHHRFNPSLKSCYERIKSESFDQAISEKTPNLMVVIGNYLWDDIGNWKSVYNLAKKDSSGNVILGLVPKNFSALNTKNSLIMVNKKNVSLIGVSDLILVENEDSLLVCSREASLQVKEALKKVEEDN
jgi:mannose-1-phosphate guanylyltransferase